MKILEKILEKINKTMDKLEDPIPVNKKNQHLAELKSFKRRLGGKRLIWFLSLSEKLQFDLFFIFN